MNASITDMSVSIRLIVDVSVCFSELTQAGWRGCMWEIEMGRRFNMVHRVKCTGHNSSSVLKRHLVYWFELEY